MANPSPDYPVTGHEIEYLQRAIEQGQLHGDGAFTKQCEAWLCSHSGATEARLTPSCTAALELAALLCNIGPGDEVIMPSYTFVSTANAFVMRGATPIFVDIRPDTLNIDETLIPDAITDRTRAIVPVHYAGVPAEMHKLVEIASDAKLDIIEDAAQALGSFYKGHAAGTIGRFGCLSFHDTKNLGCGEGGAILVQNPPDTHRLDILREKGTNRREFVAGHVDKYTWVDIGSSYLPSELQAAFLRAQLESIQAITHERLKKWLSYYQAFAEFVASGRIQLPIVPDGIEHNAHIFAVRLPDSAARDRCLIQLRSKGFTASTHYVPLHNSPAGKQYGRLGSSMDATNRTYETLLRLPVGPATSHEQVKQIIEIVRGLIASL